MRSIVVILVLMLLLPFGSSAQNYAPYVSAPGAHNAVDAVLQSGADMCAKIAAAATALSTASPTGGTIDARGFSGVQHCSGSMFAGWPSTNTFPVKVLLGAVTIQTDVTQLIPAPARVSIESRRLSTMRPAQPMPALRSRRRIASRPGRRPRYRLEPPPGRRVSASLAQRDFRRTKHSACRRPMA